MSSLGRAALVVLALAPAAPAAKAQDFRLTLHHFLSELTPSHADMLVPWAERVEALAGGRVAIDIYPNMSLGGRPAELIGQARDGIVDLVWTVNGYTPGLFPRSEVFELPTVYVNDPAASNLAMREMFDAHLAEEYEGLVVLFTHVHTGNAIHTVDREVRAPQDLARLTVRTPSRTGAWVIEALGGAPVAMPVTELPQAMARGVVEAALIPWEVAAPLRLQEQTRFQIEGDAKARFGTTVFQLSMNRGSWERLPENVQAAFRAASGEDWMIELGRIWRENDDRAIEVIEAAGNTHVTLSAVETAAFMAALEPVVERWIADVSAQGIDGRALVEHARDAIRRHAERD